jgi:hypothetical protein
MYPRNKSGIALAKVEFNKKEAVFGSKLDYLRTKAIKCYI